MRKDPITMGDEYSPRTMPLGEIRRLLPTEPVSRPLRNAQSPFGAVLGPWRHPRR